MTKDLLEQYPDICKEIEEIKSEKVTDTVSASSIEFPYEKLTASIEGVPESWKSLRLGKLQQQKNEIEEFIDTLEDSKERRVMYYRVKLGLPWGMVAAKMGHRYTEERVRHIYRRALKNF